MSIFLVTGAAGFIGSKTARFLVDGGHYVVGIDNINNYYDVRLKEHRLSALKKKPNFIFYQIDIASKSDLTPIFKKYPFEAVFNLGARAGVRASVEDPENYFKTNLFGTLNILDLMKEVNVKKLVQASTSSLYAGQELPFIETLSVNRPISPYASSKKAAEDIAYTYHHLHNIDVTIVRYFTVYGPAGRPDMSVLKFIKRIDCDEEFNVYGDGSQGRDFTFVDDIARGTILAAKPLGYEVINLGGGNNPIKLSYLITEIEKHLQRKAKIKYCDFMDADMKYTWADINKAEKMLSWKPQVSFEEGIAETVNWYKVNKQWVSTLNI